MESLYRSWGLDVAGVLERNAVDYHPPLYFLLLWMWRGLHDSEWMARAFSALAGVAFLPVVYALARRLLGGHGALWALALAALSPLHLWYSQEVRGYALFALLAAVSWLLLLRALERPSPALWSALAVTFAAALLTHPYAVLLPLSQIPVLARRGVALAGGVRSGTRTVLGGFAAAHAAALIAVLPVAAWKLAAITGWEGDARQLPAALSSAAAMETGNVGDGSALALPYTLFAWSVGYSLGPPLPALHGSGRAAAVSGHAVEILATTALFGTAAVLGVRQLRRRRWALAAVLGGVGVPLAGALLAAAVSGVAVHPRYTLLALPLYLVLLAAGVTSLGGMRGAALGGGLLTLTAYADLQYFVDPAYAREDARGVIRYVSDRARPGDLIVLNSYLRPYRHYLDAPDPVDRGVEDSDVWFPLYDRAGLRFAPLREAYATDAGVRAFWHLLPEPKRRVWLVESARWGIDPEGDLRRFLAVRFRLTERRELAQVTIDLLESRQW